MHNPDLSLLLKLCFFVIDLETPAECSTNSFFVLTLNFSSLFLQYPCLSVLFISYYSSDSFLCSISFFLSFLLFSFLLSPPPSLPQNNSIHLLWDFFPSSSALSLLRMLCGWMPRNAQLKAQLITIKGRPALSTKLASLFPMSTIHFNSTSVTITVTC